MTARLAHPFPVFPGTADTLAVTCLVIGEDFRISYCWSLLETLAAQGQELVGRTRLLVQGADYLTVEQWRNWDRDAPDKDYLLGCVAANLKLALT